MPATSEKRTIQVQVSTYYGIGVHWHVAITEDDDAFLVVIPKRPSKEDRKWYKPGEAFWWHPHDMPAEMRGRSAHCAMPTPTGAERWIAKTLKAWGVSERTHEVHWNDLTTDDDVKSRANRRWYYRDGD